LRYGVRVRRLVLLALVAVAPGSARAEDRFTAHVETYVDSDDTEVVRPSVSGAIGVTDELEVAGSYTVDVITTASIDVITNATAPAFSDRRDEAGLSATYRPLTGTEVGAGATWSDESDYRSLALALRGSQELLERNLTVSARAGLVMDEVTSVADARFADSLTGYGYAAGVQQILSPTLLIHGGYEGAYLSGYQQSPYRFVRFGDFEFDMVDGAPVFDGVTESRLERHPRRRLRHSLVAGAAWAMTRRTALQPRAQIYSDDWGVRAGELELLAFLEASERLTLRGRARAYLQSGADFYRERYLDVPDDLEHYTADKRLGPLHAYLAGIRAEYAVEGGPDSPFQRIGLDGKVEVVFNRYLENVFLDTRTALIAQLGMLAEF